MADNSNSTRQHSMAEHEMEMQRQMMSVSGGTGTPGPPPPPLALPGMVASGMPPTLSIPPPPMPPQSLPPPTHGGQQPIVPPPGPPTNFPPPPMNPALGLPHSLPLPVPPTNLQQVGPPGHNIPPPVPPTGLQPPPGNIPKNLPPPGLSSSNMLPPPGSGPNPTQNLVPPGPPPQGVMPPGTPPPMTPPRLPPPSIPAPGSKPTLSAHKNSGPQNPIPTPQSSLPLPASSPQSIGPNSNMGTSNGNQSGPISTTAPPASTPPQAALPWSAPPNSPPTDDVDEGDSEKVASLLLSETGDDLEDDGKPKRPTEVILPKALEDVLALKDQRAAQFEGDIFTVEEEKQPSQTSGVISNEYADADGDSDEEGDQLNENVSDTQKVQGKLNKNKRKKKRRKQSRKLKLNIEAGVEKAAREDEKTASNEDNRGKGEDVTIEYIPERITIADLAPMYRQFYRVFEIFKLENKPKPSEADKTGGTNELSALQKKTDEKTMDEDDDDPEEEKKDDKEKLSKRKLKKLTRLSVAELKQLVNRPDVVEMHDVTARDPKLLVQLKAHRNTVQVPRHWCFKRKYLQGKRGIEKPPFDLPAFIKKTGIMEMRESLQEKDEAKSLKAKMRERTRPKMGKIDIDYQKLHDAFFKWQTKPRMTIHGDLYYEGKEFETRLKEKKPGDLSEELRIALGMPVGPNCHKIPPPWLIAQQRYGPPPSYPNLKIPGLNAPIPDGTSFGYHAGGWGKPPVDENGKPLYGDVFGTNVVDLDNGVDEGDIERNTWGELESESEESSEEEESEGEDLVNAPDETGLVTPAEGLVTPSGLTSVPAGMETPDNIELRKRKIEAEMEDNETPVLYQVLPEKRTDRVGVSMMASTHVYDIGAVKASMAAAGVTRQPAIGDREGMVELALDPSELDMDNDAMAQRYEQQMREQQSHLQKEDLSDMLAEHVARQKSKRKRQQADTTKQNKKYKEFKF